MNVPSYSALRGSVLRCPIFKPCNGIEKCQRDGADLAVAVFCDNQIRLPFGLLLFVSVEVVGLTPKQADKIGILLDGPGFAQVAQIRLPPLSLRAWHRDSG